MGKSLIQVLNPAVKLLNQLMASLIRFAETFSKFTAELFGEQELKINTAPLQDAADAQNEYADATENAQKAQNKFIAGLDEITTLNEQESASAVAPFLSSTSGDKKNDKKDEEEQKENKLKKLLTSFKSFFKQFSPEIDGAISNIKQQLEKFKKTLERIWQDIKILGNPLKSWFSSDFTSFLKTSISSVGTILSGLLDSAEMVFSGLWDIVIFPSLVTVETKALPFFTQLGEKYVHALSTAFSAIKPVFDEVWETGVEPALSKMQAMWSETWDLLYEKWELYGGPIFEGLEEAFGNCAEFLSTWWNSFLKPIWDEFMHVVDWLWTEHLKPFVDQFLEFVAKLATGALEIYNKVIAPVVKWIIEYLYPPIARTVGFIINLIGSVIASVLDFGKGILRALSGIIDFIVGVFTGDWSRAWSGIKETVAGIMDAIGGLFRGGVNILIDILNFFIKNAISAINSVINSINKISFKAPDWVPKIGGQEIGFNIKSLPNYQIPKLATGAVIPPNAEFAAILGDQKHGRNLEAPESLLRQIAREESGGDVTVIVQLPSGEQKKVYSTKDINKRNRQSGKILIPVEVD